MNLFFLSVGLVLSLCYGLATASPIVLILFMEVTMLIFLFMIYTYKVLNYGSACMKYFLLQSMASLLLFIASLDFMESNIEISYGLVFMALAGLLLKLGAFPMHFWVVPVTQELPFSMLGVMGIPMKILPLRFIYFFVFWPQSGYIMDFILVVGVASMLVGMILGLTAVTLRAVLGASSITHTGWFFFALLSNNIIGYFLLYSLTLGLLLCALIYMMPTIVSLSFFGLSGLPPFSVFWGKVVVIANLCGLQNMYFFIVIALLSSVFSLFYYLKYSLSFFLQQNAVVGPLMILWFAINFGSMFLLFLSFFYGRVSP